MRPTAVLASALFLSTACSAWPSGWEEAVELVKREVAPLLRRATTTYNLSYTATTEGDVATTGTVSATGTSGDDGSAATTTTTDTDATETGTQTGTAASTGTKKATGTITEAPTTTGGIGFANSTSLQSYDPRLPAGGISMITPNPFSTQYYKINDYVTFAWNYTSVSKLPTAIDILASCALNSATYTLALNESVPGPTQAFTWDTGAWQVNATASLPNSQYTLIVHDSNKDVSAVASPGYLGTAEQFTFAMYSPSPYQTTAYWLCATCSSAVTAAERQTVVAILAMAGLTVLSFGWFTGVAGLW